MTRGGRPLRFVGAVLGGWIALRVVVLAAPDEPPLAANRTPPVRVAMLASATTVPRAYPRASPLIATARQFRSDVRIPSETHDAVVLTSSARLAPTFAASPLASGSLSSTPLSFGQFAAAEPVAHERLADRGGSRWSGSAWAILRPVGASTSVLTPQLGGSQAGARIAYALDDRGRFALAARAATALRERQSDAAIGIEFRPSGSPVRLVVEQRIGIANTRGGPAIGLVGGIAPTPIAAGFALEAYAQAGAIARRPIEGYADGAVRAARPIARVGHAPLNLGLGAWGAAQRDAARLDIGPTATLVLPVAGQAIRVSLDYGIM